MIDNFAHIGGFVVGILASMLVCSYSIDYEEYISHFISFMLLVQVIPKLTIPPSTIRKKRKRRCMIITRIVTASVLLTIYFGIGLALVLMKIDVAKACPFCEYISCLPVFEDCRKMMSTSYNYTLFAR